VSTTDPAYTDPRLEAFSRDPRVMVLWGRRTGRLSAASESSWLVNLSNGTWTFDQLSKLTPVPPTMQSSAAAARSLSDAEVWERVYGHE
jgi:hypothetical protein